jgi:hypothetical protein
MKICVNDGTQIDTDDLSSEERHILQKLLCYKEFVGSVDQFREKKKRALLTGWNNSGPVRESNQLNLIAAKLENDLLQRLQSASDPQS